MELSPESGRPRMGRVLIPVLAAILATAVAVPVTWYAATYVATREHGATVPPAFAGREELRDHLAAQLPEGDGAVVLEPSHDRETGVAVPPGRYRVDLICGLMRRRGTEPQDMSLYLRTNEQMFAIQLPCPSTVQSLPDRLDFTGTAAGAVMVYLEFSENRAASVLLMQLVPVGEDEGGSDA